MNRQITDILEQSMKEVVLEAVAEVNIKEIMAEQIKSVVESTARSMFSNYGEFSQQLETKLKGELQFNIDSISVPEFGELAISTVKAELAAIESEQAKQISLKAEERLRNFLGTHNKPIVLSELVDVFATEAWEDHIKYGDYSCSCDSFEPRGADDLSEYLASNDSEYELAYILHERASHFSSWDSCTTHLILKLTKGTKPVHEISLHLNRERDEVNKETYENDDFYNSKHSNFYKIIGVEINGKSVSDSETSTIHLDRTNDRTTKQVLGCFMNKQLINANELGFVELEAE